VASHNIGKHSNKCVLGNLKDWGNMRVYINRALEQLNSDSVLAKRKIYDSLGKDAWRWRRVRPFVFANGRTTNRANEVLGAMRNVDELRSQFGQDAFVLSQLSFKKGGYFVDFGATDGISGSNSYILEKRYGWNGVLAEPARCWHAALQRNRSAHIELACVTGKSGESVAFYEKGMLSSMRRYISFGHKLKRLTKPRRFYEVPTISLLDLLRKHRAPEVIDYLSMDTEGSEPEILGAFDFSAYRFRVITCEHNYAPRRDRTFALLSSHGYDRVFESISEADDWYVLRDRGLPMLS
jgi:FkbM family methyltransferase